MAALSGIEGALEGRRIDVGEGEVTVGRENVDVVVEDREVSRRHASIRRTDRGLELTDLGSTNGTFVNDRRIEEPTIVTDGDVIRIGGNKLRVEDDWQAAETIATPAVGPASKESDRDAVPDYVPAPEESEAGFRSTEPLPARRPAVAEPRDRRPWIVGGIAALVAMLLIVGYMLFFGGDDDFATQAENVCTSTAKRAKGITLTASRARLRRDIRRLQRARANAGTRLRRLEPPEDVAERVDTLLSRMKATDRSLSGFGRALSSDKRKAIARARSSLRRAARRERSAAKAADLPACGRLVLR